MKCNHSLKTVNSKNYLVTTYSNGVVIDYSKGISVEVVPELITIFKELSDKYFDESLVEIDETIQYYKIILNNLCKNINSFKVIPILLSPIDSKTLVSFKSENSKINYILIDDVNFKCILEHKLKINNILYKYIDSQNELKLNDYSEVYNKLFYPKNALGTNYKNNNEEIKFGDVIYLDINANNKELLNIGKYNLNEMPITKIKIKIDNSISKSTNKIGNISYFIGDKEVNLGDVESFNKNISFQEYFNKIEEYLTEDIAYIANEYLDFKVNKMLEQGLKLQEVKLKYKDILNEILEGSFKMIPDIVKKRKLNSLKKIVNKLSIEDFKTIFTESVD